MKGKIKLIFSILFLIILILPSLNACILHTKINNTENDFYKDSTNNKEIFDLLIISPQKFVKYLQPLVIHKENFGIKTKLVSVEDILSSIYRKGRTDEEIIKYFIFDEFKETAIEYVLFVGGKVRQSGIDKYWVPEFYSKIERGYLRENGELWPEQHFLSDLYFADIIDSEGNFSSWDSNKNAIFAEWPLGKSAVDVYDMYPDICVGRLPCRNVIDVIVIVNKIINYESSKADDSWFKKFLTVAGDTYPGKTDFYDGEVYTQRAIDLMPEFDPVKVWASKGTLTDWKSIVPPINEGCGFAFFSGHGGPGTWSTHPPDDEENWIGGFQNKYMKYLINGYKLPVVLCASGCFVSMYNVSWFNRPYLYGLTTLSKCWSSNLLHKFYGGSIATIGSSGFSYESSDIRYNYGGCEMLDIFFFGQYGMNGTDILGHAWKNSITTFLENYTINWSDSSINGSALVAKNAQQWILFGDPSLKIGGYDKAEMYKNTK
jgi:hypothetical protein